MKWIKHDTLANQDAKLKKVMIKYGMEGYGLYWRCLELIAINVDVNNLTFELDHDAELLSHDTGIHIERINEMMAFMVDLGLFENSDGIITCMKIAKRLDQSMTSNPEMRKIIHGVRNSHDAVMTQSDIVMQDKIRLDKNRLDKSSRFTPPTLLEVKEYVEEKGYQVDCQKFINFYDSKGWMVGKNKMKKWKAAIANWNSKPVNNSNPWDGAI